MPTCFTSGPNTAAPESFSRASTLVTPFPTNASIGCLVPFLAPRSSGPRHLRHGALDRLHDAHIAGAATQVPGNRATDLDLGRRRVFVEQRFGGEQHARDAVAALHGPFLDESLLQWMEVPLAAEPLDREHLFAVGFRRQHQARVERLAVEEHGAGPAVPLAASFLGPHQP